MSRGSNAAVCKTVLGLIACLLAGHAHSQVIQNHLIVEYTSRPASMVVDDDSLDTGQAGSDNMIEWQALGLLAGTPSLEPALVVSST